jgi:hypothetical protein
MAVLAKNANVAVMGTPVKISVPCGAADIFYEGAVIWADFSSPSGSIIVNCAPAAGDKVLGICARQVTTTALGDLVDIYTSGIFAVKGMTNVDASDIGGYAIFLAAALTDNPTDMVSTVDATETVNSCMVGKIVSYYDSTAYVELGPGVTGWIYNATSVDWEY